MRVRIRSMGCWNRNAYKPEPHAYGWVWMYMLVAANGLIAREDVPGDGRGMPFDDDTYVEMPDEEWCLEKTDWDKIVPDEDEVYL